MTLSQKESFERSSSTSDANNDLLLQDSQTLALLLDEMGKVIVGQEAMCRGLLLGLLTGGHVLLEGLPGLAKTLAVKTLASILDAKFQRVQFTPDLLPSDLIGTMIYREKTGEFAVKKGPIFCNILLADEINRAPAKVQSALLEAMAEHQVTIGETSYPLEEPFMVMATQNPIEQEGTYPLPEAQLDRFMFKLKVGYPTRDQERAILERMSGQESGKPRSVFPASRILEIRKRCNQLYMDDRIKEYVLRLVMATRDPKSLSEKECFPEKLSELTSAIELGASPRATLYLSAAAKAQALLEQRNYVIPDDVKAIACDILRHRLALSFDADVKKITSDDVVHSLLDAVKVP